MVMNWKLRLQNKATLIALVLATIAFVYQVIGMLGLVPAISQDNVVNAAGLIINILVAFGVLVDPTTDGVNDSKQAMTYEKPKVDTEE